MKYSNSDLSKARKKKQNKTALDGFRLFYEEIPLELENHIITPSSKPKDRLMRRSKTKL